MLCNSSLVEIPHRYKHCPAEILHSLLHIDSKAFTLVLNEQLDLILASKTIESYFNISLENIIGSNWKNILPLAITEPIQNRLLRGFDGKKVIPNIIWKNNEGETFTFETIIDHIFDKNQSLYIAHVKDTTLNDQLTQTMSDVEKLILAGQLSAGLVHEIRNPLTSIKGFLQLIQAGIDQKDEYYRVIINEVEKIEMITFELLQLAKPLKQEKQVVEVNQLMDDVLFLMRTQSDLREVTFKIESEPNVLIHCNPVQIKQAFINLIKNGAEAMNKSGEIMVEIYTEKESVIIQIADEGSGISDNQLSELLQPFYTTKTEGTGLGLVITQRIIEMHSGILSVSSTSKEGTIFTISLPQYKFDHSY